MEPVRNERERNLNMVFTTALEGGIGYWSVANTYRWAAPTDDPNAFEGTTEARDFYADIVDFEDDDKPYRIDRKVIARGIRLAYENRHTMNSYHREALSAMTFRRWDEADYDADTADIIVQFGLFGKLVYG